MPGHEFGRHHLTLAVPGTEVEQAPGVSPKAPPGNVGKKKKAAKVRSAWISFVGRVVAQVTGAVATVVLGVVFLHRYSVVDKHQAQADPAPARPAVASVVRPAGQITFAVLPFQNLTGDPRKEYLADGLTETLTADLAASGGLHVVSRTSAMRFKNDHRMMREIARELGVDLVVEGSVAMAGSHVRATAQLIDAPADDHIWARHYDLTERNPLTIEAEVSTAIATDIRAAAASRTALARPGANSVGGS